MQKTTPWVIMVVDREGIGPSPPGCHPAGDPPEGDKPNSITPPTSGPEGNRTPGLLIANEAFYH